MCGAGPSHGEARDSCPLAEAFGVKDAPFLVILRDECYDFMDANESLEYMASGLLPQFVTLRRS